MSLNNSTGTDWSEILQQVTKLHVPVGLVREVQFIYQGDIRLRLDMEGLDADTVTAFGKSLYESRSHDMEIKLMIDVGRLSQTVSGVVEPLLKNLPRRDSK
jgi:hypothetical protein